MEDILIRNELPQWKKKVEHWTNSFDESKTSRLNKLVTAALNRIIAVSGKYPDNLIITGHSGGKDSCVLHDLVRKVICHPIIVHNVKPLLGTSGDPIAALTEIHPKTLEFMYGNVCTDTNVVFTTASKMPDFIKMNDIKCQFDGSRRTEALREGKSSSFVRNGELINRQFMTEFVEQGLFGISMSYPLFDWSDDDIFNYILRNNLPLSEEYTDNGELKKFLKRNQF